jgi:hypothetical protein
MDSNFLGSLLADSEWPMNGISCSSAVDGLYCAVNVSNLSEAFADVLWSCKFLSFPCHISQLSFTVIMPEYSSASVWGYARPTPPWTRRGLSTQLSF